MHYSLLHTPKNIIKLTIKSLLKSELNSTSTSVRGRIVFSIPKIINSFILPQLPPSLEAITNCVITMRT